MKAIVVSSVGPAEVLQPSEVPDPVPGAGELLVEARRRPASTSWTCASAGGPPPATGSVRSRHRRKRHRCRGRAGHLGLLTR